MRVDLIDYTGMFAADRLYAARHLIYVKNTRLTQGLATRLAVSALSEEQVMEELDAIAKTIRSSWEFVDYTFEITGVTRAFTHQFVRTRTASYAQQAQRVADMGDFKTRVPATVVEVDDGSHWNDLMRQIASTYQYYAEAGVPKQDCRGVLPTNVYTNIIAKMNLRTFADIVGKRENLRAQDEYAAEVVPAMKKLVLGVHPWVQQFISPVRTATPFLDAILRDALGNRSPVDVPAINSALKELDALKAVWG